MAGSVAGSVGAWMGACLGAWLGAWERGWKFTSAIFKGNTKLLGAWLCAECACCLFQPRLTDFFEYARVSPGQSKIWLLCSCTCIVILFCVCWERGWERAWERAWENGSVAGSSLQQDFKVMLSCREQGWERGYVLNMPVAYFNLALPTFWNMQGFLQARTRFGFCAVARAL